MAHATAGFQWMDIQFGKMHDVFLSNEASLMRVGAGAVVACRHKGKFCQSGLKSIINEPTKPLA